MLKRIASVVLVMMMLGVILTGVQRSRSGGS